MMLYVSNQISQQFLEHCRKKQHPFEEPTEEPTENEST